MCLCLYAVKMVPNLAANTKGVAVSGLYECTITHEISVRIGEVFFEARQKNDIVQT